jgi:SAM-dependent methyltransferase
MDGVLSRHHKKNRGVIRGDIAKLLLKQFTPRDAPASETALFPEAEILSNLILCFGAEFPETVKNKSIIDFGCGLGRESVAMARLGAKSVNGLEISQEKISQAGNLALKFGVAEKCFFSDSAKEKVDLIISKDAFEHFREPGVILDLMAGMLKPQGRILVSFGPTWYHPYGGHLFSFFPWSHLLFSEKDLIEWRAQFRNDGATRFSEVEGGLNQLTIAGFKELVSSSRCQIERIDTLPIRGLSMFKSDALHEFGSSLVRCELSLRK